MEPSNKEIENVIKLNAFERYQYTIKKIVDFQQVFILKIDEDWAFSEVEGNKLISIWPAKQYAEMLIKNEWSKAVVVDIELQHFKEMLLEIKQNEYLINVFSVEGLTGFIVDADELLTDIEFEEENYT